MNRERAAVGTLVAGAAGIAFAPIFVRWALPAGVGPAASAFWRLALAAPVLWAWAWTAGERPWRLRPRLLWPGLYFALDIATWHWAIRYTSVANSTLLANMAPVFVTLGGWLVWRRRVTRGFLGGLGLALLGAAVLFGASAAGGRRDVLGDGLGLLTAVFYASYILAVGRLREDFSTAAIMAWSASVAAVLLFPVALAAGEPVAPPSARAWTIVAGLALVSHVGGQGLIAYALAHLPAAFSSVVLLLQPLGASLLAWLFFSEPVGGRQAAGAALVISGILLARRESLHTVPGQK